MTGRLLHSAMALVLAGSLVVTPAFAQSQGGSANPAAVTAQGVSQAPTPEPATDTASGTPVENRALKYGPDYSNGKRWFPAYCRAVHRGPRAAAGTHQFAAHRSANS